MMLHDLIAGLFYLLLLGGAVGVAYWLEGRINR